MRGLPSETGGGVGGRANGGRIWNTPLQAQIFRYTKSEQLKQILRNRLKFNCTHVRYQIKTPRCTNFRLSMCLKFKLTGGRILKVGESGDSYTLSAVFLVLFLSIQKKYRVSQKIQFNLHLSSYHPKFPH